jgi:hypothetical protein
VQKFSCSSTFADKALFVVNEKRSGKESALFKLKFSDEATQADFGNPLVEGGPSYSVCVYKESGDLAGEFRVDRSGATDCNGKSCWKSIGKPPPDPTGKGYKFKDPDLASDGVKLLSLQGGPGRPGKIILKASNKSSTMPLGMAAALDGDTVATVQVSGSGVTRCFEAARLSVVRSDASFYKGKQ